MYNYTNYIISILIILLITYIIFDSIYKNKNIENFSECAKRPKTVEEQDEWFKKLEDDFCKEYVNETMKDPNNNRSESQLRMICKYNLLPYMFLNDQKNVHGIKILSNILQKNLNYKKVNNLINEITKYGYTKEVLKDINKLKYVKNCNIPAHPLIWEKLEGGINPQYKIEYIDNPELKKIIKDYATLERNEIELTEEIWNSLNINDLRMNNAVSIEINQDISIYLPKYNIITYKYNIKLGNKLEEYKLNYENIEDLCKNHNYCDKSNDKCIINSEVNKYIKNYSNEYIRWVRSPIDYGSTDYLQISYKIPITQNLNTEKYKYIQNLLKENNWQYFDLSSLTDEKYKEYSELFDGNTDIERNKEHKFIQVQNTDDLRVTYTYIPQPKFYNIKNISKNINKRNKMIITNIDYNLKNPLDENKFPCIINKYEASEIAKNEDIFDLNKYLEKNELESIIHQKYGKVQENINVGQNLDDYNNKYNKLEKYIKQKNEIITAENDCLYYSSNSNKEPKIPINFEYDNGEKINKWGKNIKKDVVNIKEEDKNLHIQNTFVKNKIDSISQNKKNCVFTKTDVNNWNNSELIYPYKDNNDIYYGIINNGTDTEGYINNGIASNNLEKLKKECKSIYDENNNYKSILNINDKKYGRNKNLTFNEQLSEDKAISNIDKSYPYIKNDIVNKTIDKVCYSKSLNDNGIEKYGYIGKENNKYGKIGDKCDEYISSQDCENLINEYYDKEEVNLSDEARTEKINYWNTLKNREKCYWNNLNDKINIHNNDIENNYRNCVNNLLKEKLDDNQELDLVNPLINNNDKIKKTYKNLTKFIWIRANNNEDLSNKIDISDIISNQLKNKIKVDIEQNDTSEIDELEWKEFLLDNHYNLIKDNDILDIYFIYNNNKYITYLSDIFWNHVYKKYKNVYETNRDERKEYLHSRINSEQIDCIIPDNHYKDGTQCENQDYKCLYKTNKSSEQLNNTISNLDSSDWYNNLKNEGKLYAENNFKGRYYNSELGQNCELCTDKNNTKPYNFVAPVDYGDYCDVDNTKKCSRNTQNELIRQSSKAYDWMKDYENKCRETNEISCIRDNQLI